jgi:TolB-like protein
MPDIFLSYNREDQAVARRFADAFVAQGLDVWWDVTLRSGEAYDEVTEAALRDANAVVVLWSNRSVRSRWVRAEATVADRAGTLLPVMIEPCERPIMFELVQTADLSAWKGNVADRAFQVFLADLRRFLAGERPPEPTSLQAAIASAFRLPDKPSIAVLPFAELGGADDGFADGVVEEISTALSQFQTLFVIAGSSSLTYRDPNRDPAKVCRELGVRYLLEGSVRRSGERVRITTKLIDGVEGEQVWADKFEDRLDDIFELQDRIAHAVAALIDSTIDTNEVRRAVARPTSSPDANELYWRANATFRKFNKDALQESAALAGQVLGLEPNNAWAAALAGFCHASMFAYGWSDDRAASRTTAMAHYEHAMRIAGDDPRVLGYCSAILVSLSEQPETATRLVDRTLALNPGSATGLFWAGWNDVLAGRPERGLERLEAALRLNPRSMVRPLTLTGMGLALFAQRRFDEAAGVLTEAVQQLPTFPPALGVLAATQGHRGLIDEGRELAARLQAVSGSGGPALMRDPNQLELLFEGFGRLQPSQSNPA